MKIHSFMIGLVATAYSVPSFAEPALLFPESALLAFENRVVATSYQLPTGPFEAGKSITIPVKGSVSRKVWHTAGSPEETYLLIEQLRNQLLEDGFSVIFECASKDCGGYDFRFKTDVVEEPVMHVDLGDFRFVSASRTKDGAEEYVSLLVSKSQSKGFVQVTSIGKPDASFSDITASTKQSTPETTQPDIDQGLAEILTVNGSSVLEGLTFIKGSSDLSGTPAQALQDLAAFLSANPDKRLVLVGHTDASGSLEGNISLSKKRASSVVQRLIETYGVDPNAVSFAGVGYYSPRASNATEGGREMNRRVEAVLIE